LPEWLDDSSPFVPGDGKTDSPASDSPFAPLDVRDLGEFPTEGFNSKEERPAPGNAEEGPHSGLKTISSAGPSEREIPTVQCVVDLAWLREQPGMKRALRLPAADAGVQMLLGGYLDMLRRGSRSDLTFELAPDGVQLLWRVAVDLAAQPPEWAGFLGGHDRPLAPPLAASQRLVSGSGYRDHRPMWQHRERLLQATEIVRIEADDRRVKATGARLGFQDLLELLGPRLRLLVVEGPGGDDPRGNWPQLAIAFETRDVNRFRQEVWDPLRQWARSAAPTVQARFEQRSLAAAELWSWHPGPGEPAWQQAFVPSVVLAGDQLLVASHDRLATELRSQLERRDPGERLRPVSGLTQVSLPGLARTMQAWRGPLAEQAAQQTSLSARQAEEKLDQIVALLRELGTLELRTSQQPGRFEFRTRLTGPD